MLVMVGVPSVCPAGEIGEDALRRWEVGTERGERGSLKQQLVLNEHLLLALGPRRPSGFQPFLQG